MIGAIARWSVHNRVTANILMAVFLIGGLFAIMGLRTELFPEFTIDMVSVSVVYPGASPQEVEEGICIKIEERIAGVQGVKNLRSQASEGIGSVVAELHNSVSDPQRVLDDIRSEVDRIDTFPDDAKEPVISEIRLRDPAIRVAVYGDLDENTLRLAAERLRDEIAELPEVSQVQLDGARDREISVAVPEWQLRALNMSLEDVGGAIRKASLDLPAGSIKAASAEILVRARGQRYTKAQFSDVPVKTLPDGTVILLGQIATIRDGFEDIPLISRYQGKPAVIVAVFKTPDEDILEVVGAVKRYVEQVRDTYPTAIGIEDFGDFSVLVRSRMNLLARNGLQGFMLVLLVLWFFLHARLAFWVAMGIPISLLGAMVFLWYTGQTLNLLSLFAFIMVLGIVVDDAIVFGENIYRHRGLGKPPVQAAIDGAAEVGGPVTMSVLTTVVAFMPMLFVSGIMGKFIAVLPKAVITILLISLFEAFFILPSHLAGALEHERTPPPWAGRIRDRIDGWIEWAIHSVYDPLLRWTLENRYFAFSIAVAILIAAFGLVAGGRVPFVIFPTADSDYVFGKVVFPPGTSFATTRAAVRQMEEAVLALNREYPPPNGASDEKLVQRVYSLAGGSADPNEQPPPKGSNIGGVYVELLGSEKRTMRSDKVLKRWRELTGEIPGADKVQFRGTEGGPPGSPIEVQLIGDDFGVLTAVADRFKEKIRTYSGTFDVQDDFAPGKPEIQVEALPAAYPLNVTQQNLASAVRAAYYGYEADRIQRGRDDIKVMVRYPEEERRQPSSLAEIRVRTPSGAEVPLTQVARVGLGRGYSDIRRYNRRRVVNVTSDLDETQANAREIITNLARDFVPGIRRDFPQVKISFEGQEQQTRESVGSLMKGLLYALLGCFALLAIQTRSYLQPLIIMTAIPFGIIGAVVGHIVLGFNITLISLFGIVALAGIVVNDSIVLMSFINSATGSGLAPTQAAAESGVKRFRAVMLTSLTTIAGLLPITLERSFQAQFLIPMAISIAFGLLFSTFLVLVLVPALYLILQDIKHLFGR